MEKESRSKKKIFILFIIILLLAGITTYFILNKSNIDNEEDSELEVGETINVEEPLNYLVKSENGEYFLTKVNPDIKFKVTTDNVEPRYKLIDEDENEVKTNTTRIDNYYEIAGDKNYEAGKTYKLALENATFVEEKLKDVKVLNFTIVRPNANVQVLNDNVKKVNNQIITDVKENGDNFILTSKNKYENGDILYYENEKDIKAFKVDKVSKENNNYIINTKTPELKEVYKELDVYGEFEAPITDFVSSEELKEYIKTALKDSSILNCLGTTVYAAEDEDELIEIDVKPQKDGSVKVIITLNLQGEGNSFINLEEMKNHEIVFEMELTLRLKSYSEINFFKTDIGANIDVEITRALSIRPKEDYWEEFKEEENKNDIESVEIAKEILKNLKEGKMEEEQDILLIKIPTPVAGLTLDLRFKLFEELRMAFELDAKETTTVKTTFGYKTGVTKANKVGFYWNSTVNTTERNFEALGKADIKIGMRPHIVVNFVEIIKVGATVSIGGYAEGEVSYILKTDGEDKVEGNFEYGVFVDGSIYGKLANVKLTEITIFDKKWPMKKFGSSTQNGKDKEKNEKGEQGEAQDEIERALDGDFSAFAGEYNMGIMLALSLDEDGIASGTYMGKDFSGTKPISITKEDDGSIKCLIYKDSESEDKDEYYKIYPIGVVNKFLVIGQDDINKVRISYHLRDELNGDPVYTKDSISILQ